MMTFGGKKIEMTQLFCKTGWMDEHWSGGGRMGQ